MKKLVLLMVVAGLVFAANAATETIDGVTYTYFDARITKISGDAKTIVIPATLGGKTITKLESLCLQNNTTVMKVVVPDAVTIIGASAFEGCIALTSVNIPAGVNSIGSNTFDGCAKLRSIVLPPGLKTIGQAAFGRCSSLQAIELPDGLTSIGVGAFEMCSSLQSIEIPDTVTTIGGNPFSKCSELKSARLPAGLTAVSSWLFGECGKLEHVEIPSGVTVVNDSAFWGCYALKELILPASVNRVGTSAFFGVGRVIFQGKPPAGLASSELTIAVYPKEFGAQWRKQIEVAKINGYYNPNKPVVSVVSSRVRENNPTILDVVYKVTSTKTTVKVRALAFEDGERTFSKVTRPETFIEGTDANLGDAITPNVEHKLSWQVSSDFKTDLAKMKFELLAVEDGILPLEFITIPANGKNKKMQLSWNLLTEAQVFDALLWLYADKDEGLVLSDGVLKRKSDGYVMSSPIVPLSDKNGYVYREWILGHYVDGPDYFASAPEYVMQKMGLAVLSGDELGYANEMTRLGLSPDGIRQYAYKWIDE